MSRKNDVVSIDLKISPCFNYLEQKLCLILLLAFSPEL